jgi:hypothetical protein
VLPLVSSRNRGMQLQERPSRCRLVIAPERILRRGQEGLRDGAGRGDRPLRGSCWCA